jgi:hypothetical protein
MALVTIMFMLLLGMVIYLSSAFPAAPKDKTLLQCATRELSISVLTNVLSAAISNTSGLRELVPKWRVSVFDELGILIDSLDRV